MSAATATLSRNSDSRPGHDTTPRSPADMSPAKKLSPTSRTPAAEIESTKASTSSSAGVAVANGHQNSTAVNPAVAAAAARASTGRSANTREQFTAKRS